MLPHIVLPKSTAIQTRGCMVIPLVYYLLKTSIKGTIFALEQLLPSMFVPVMSPNALNVTRGKFTKFTV